MMRDLNKIKCFFGSHEWEGIATHKYSNRTLFRCTRCGKYLHFHYGIGVSYILKDHTDFEELVNWYTSEDVTFFHKQH